jgi:hypothetical protein
MTRHLVEVRGRCVWNYLPTTNRTVSGAIVVVVVPYVHMQQVEPISAACVKNVLCSTSISLVWRLRREVRVARCVRRD